MELTFHDGTVRDMVFMQDTSNKSSLLISGGAGDCKIYVTDCETGTPIRVMSGHTGLYIQTHTCTHLHAYHHHQPYSILITFNRHHALYEPFMALYSHLC